MEGPPQTSAESAGPPPDPRRDGILRQLLDLAYRVSSRLRRHALPFVRANAALLLAASIVVGDLIVNRPAPPGAPPPIVQAAPLAREVRFGLPTASGHYQLVPGSLSRDVQGIYGFSWLAADGSSHAASASSVRLMQGEAEELEVVNQGEPILHLKGDTSIPIVQSPNASPDPSYAPSYWYPLRGLSYLPGPYYYDPPTTVVSGSTIEGGARSGLPSPLAGRAIGISHAVSGRAGGIGAGTAASSKAGVNLGGKAATASGVGAKAGGFSAGTGGGGGGAAST